MSRFSRLTALLLLFVTSSFAGGPRPLLPRPQKLQHGKGRLRLSSLMIPGACALGCYVTPLQGSHLSS